MVDSQNHTLLLCAVKSQRGDTNREFEVCEMFKEWLMIAIPNGFLWWNVDLNPNILLGISNNYAASQISIKSIILTAVSSPVYVGSGWNGIVYN